MAALRRLPAAQREAIALHHLADLPVAEVAAHPGRARGHRQGAPLAGPRRPRRAARTVQGGRPCLTLRDLPDLAGDVRERVVIPPYAEVSRRVRARRLRGAVGAMAAAVVVVGGVAVWQSVATTAGPSIPQPADHTQGPIPPTDESQWRAVVDGTDSHPFEIQGTDDGSIAVVWRALEPGAPTFALVIREADGSVHGMRLDEPVSLTPVPGGWVGMDGARGHLIGSDGSWTDLDETATRSATGR